MIALGQLFGAFVISWWLQTNATDLVAIECTLIESERMRVQRTAGSIESQRVRQVNGDFNN